MAYEQRMKMLHEFIKPKKTEHPIIKKKGHEFSAESQTELNEGSGISEIVYHAKMYHLDIISALKKQNIIIEEISI